jgi:hypothetical protein
MPAEQEYEQASGAEYCGHCNATDDEGYAEDFVEERQQINDAGKYIAGLIAEKHIPAHNLLGRVEYVAFIIKGTPLIVQRYLHGD